MTSRGSQFLGIILRTLLLIACVGCGNSQDFSSDNELAKSQTPSGKAATEAANGAKAHAALMVPNQKHP